MSASRLPGQPAAPTADAVIWHDAEHGSYAADLDLWERLAREFPGGVVDLGAGTGRVSLHLAASGHRVVAVDTDEALLAALAERAGERSLEAETVCCDARRLDLGSTYPLIIAPMQLLHIAGGRDGRRALMSGVASHLEDGGRFCAALLDDAYEIGGGRPDPLPDVREIGGWVYSSLPTEIRIGRRRIEMRRLRQRVAPDGTLDEEPSSISLDRFSMAEFDRDAAAAGLRVVDAEMIPSSREYEDSIAMSLERRHV
jgi:SAM-dependent methyltransferase